AQQVMRELISTGRVTRGWIGVEPQDISAELAASFNLPSPKGQTLQGVVITGVLQNGPAAKAGIRPGDVITGVEQHKVGNVTELLRQVAALPPGKPARLQVWRAQGLTELTVTPGQRPAPAQRR
ncbi:MAG: S1C family serine protease, partial [Limnohabitans sp.]